MLSNKIESNLQGNVPTRDVLEAYDPELETCQQLFARRYPRHAGVLDLLGKVESVNEPFYIKVAEPESGSRNVFGFLPNVRCSF